jgi:hypothetical protein
VDEPVVVHCYTTPADVQDSANLAAVGAFCRKMGREARRGKVEAGGGYFGAMQLLTEIEVRFRVPSGGGRPTDPRWSERPLLPLAPKTLKKLEEMAAKVREHGVNVEPMQLAALLIERTAEQLSEEEAEDLVRPKQRASR